MLAGDIPEAGLVVVSRYLRRLNLRADAPVLSHGRQPNRISPTQRVFACTSCLIRTCRISI